MVVNSLNYAYNKGELCNSQKQAVITLILKNSKDKRKVENYRPITLLNVDFKIGSKVIYFFPIIGLMRYLNFQSLFS